MASITTLTASQQAQFFYVTYYGRPADPAGLSYWSGVIGSSGLESAARDFAKSDEAKVKYPSLGSTSDATQLKADIQALYKTVFGRDPLATNPATGLAYDAAGLDYWYAGVVAGDFSFAQLPIILYDAAAANPVTQQDVLAIGNRQNAAQSFTESLKTPAQIAAYSGQTAVTSSSTWLATVDYRAESLTAAVATKSDLIFNLVINPDKPNTASPVIAAASVSVNEGAVASGAISATDADGTTLIYSADAASAQGGTVAINASTGAFTYTPKADFAGTDSFKVSVSDGQGGVTVSTVSVTVKEVNEVKPNATLAATEDSVASGKIDFINPGAETLVAVVKTQGAHGTVAFVANATDGSYTYTPKADYNGSDTFVIQVTDGTKVSTQQVTVTVAAVNDAPVIATAAETISVTEDVAFTTGMVGATDADTKDASPDVITYTAAGASKGTVTFTAAGDYTYTPKANANGEDSFVITATDKAGATATKTVAVNIASVNDAPVAAATAALSTNEDVSITGSMSASDADGSLTYAVTQGLHGVVAVDSAGTYSYSPALNFNGSDTFAVTATDDAGAAVSQVVTVLVAAVNDAPVLAASDTITATEDVVKAGVIVATDVDNTSLSYSISAQASHGEVLINPSTGAYTYNPSLNFNGSDSFTVSVSDGSTTVSQLVTVNVAAANDAPLAGITAQSSVVAGGTVSINPLAVATDVDTNDTISLVSASASSGSVAIVDGKISFTAKTGTPDVAPVTITYVLSDGTDTATGTAAVQVQVVTGGGTGNDTLGGSSQAEEITGGAGDDLINGGGGSDEIYGGDGNDTVAFSRAAAIINGGDGSDWLQLPLGGSTLRFDLTASNQYAGGSAPIVQFFENVDASRTQVSVTVTGSSDANSIIGGVTADSIIGNGGSDWISGGRGNDEITAGAGNDTIYGGDGNDNIAASTGVNLVYGDAGADTISSGSGTVYGGTGSDLITSASSAVGALYGDGLTTDLLDGNDTIDATGAFGVSIFGGGGADSINAVQGSAKNNWIDAGDGNDIVLADGKDTIELGSGANTLSGTTGDSLTVSSGDGNNVINIDGSYDKVSLGSGSDIVTLSAELNSTATISGGAGSDTLSLSLGDASTADSDFMNISGIEVIVLSAAGSNQTLTFDGDSTTLDDVSLSIRLSGSDTVRLEDFDATPTITLSTGGAALVVADSDMSVVIIADTLNSADSLQLAGSNDVMSITPVSDASFAFDQATSVELINVIAGADTSAETITLSGLSRQTITLSDATGDTVKLSVSGDSVTVNGGSYNDTASVTGASEIHAGAGADSIAGNSSGADTLRIFGDAGNDTIIINGANDYVDAGDGNDLITLSGLLTQGTMMGGLGIDTIQITGDSIVSSSDIQGLSGIEVLKLATSSDSISLDGDSVSVGADGLTIVVDGADTVRLVDFDGQGQVTIDLTGAGTSAVYVYADSNASVIFTADSLNSQTSVDAYGSADSFKDTVGTSQTYDFTNTGDSANGGIELIHFYADGDTTSERVTAVGLSNGQIFELHEAAGDTVTAYVSGSTMSVTTGSYADSVHVTSGGIATISTGDGADTVTGTTSADSVSLNAGGGNDVISLNGAADNISAGDGDDLIVLTGTTIGTIAGGAGVDTLSLAVGTYADTMFTHVSGIEVLNLSANNAADSGVTLGDTSHAAIGITTILVDGSDTLSLVNAGAVTVRIDDDAGTSLKLTSDSLTSVTLVADSTGIQGTDTISLAGSQDVLLLSGGGNTTADLENIIGLESITVTSAAVRTVTIDNIELALTVSVAAADTKTSLYAIVEAASDSVVVTISGGSAADSVYMAADTDGSLYIDLGAGADSVVARSGSDWIDVAGSTAGDTADANYVSAGSGNDTVLGGGGNDTLDLGVGHDSVVAGSGNDFVTLGGRAETTGGDYIDLGAGDDTLSGSGDSSPGAYVLLGAGSDSIVLGNGNDTILIGDFASDTMADVITAGSGADYIILGSGADTVDLGAGNDTLYAGEGANRITDSAGANFIVTGSGADSMGLGAGADTVSTGAGNDTVVDSAGNNRITTGDGSDSVVGGTGNDYIELTGTVSSAADSNWASGDLGNDTLLGGYGNDTLSGGKGNDSIFGYGGADSISIGDSTGADYADAGDGDDIIYVEAGGLNAITDAGGFQFFDTLIGGAGNDTLSLAGDGMTIRQANLFNVSGFETILIAGSDASQTNAVVVTDGLIDGTLSISFTGADSVSVDNSNVTETGTFVVSADSTASALTLMASSFLTEELRIYASDSLDGDLSISGGSSNDKVVILEQTMADTTATFTIDAGRFGTLELAADTAGNYNIEFTDNSWNGSMLVTVTGAGADSTPVIFYSDAADSVSITITTGVYADTISTDNLVADYINAGNGANSVVSGSGNDTVITGTGNDTINAGAGNDSVVAGGGANVIFLDTGIDFVSAGSGADSVGVSGSDTLGDTYQLGGGADTVYAGSGSDFIDVYGDSGADSADYVVAGSGNDTVISGLGADTIDAGAGKDSILAGLGDDRILLAVDTSGVDYINLGGGADSLGASADTTGVYVIFGDSADTAGDDTVLTGSGNDTIVLGGADDSVDAGAGNDSIVMGGGADSVTPGLGVDIIDLGLSADSSGDKDWVFFSADSLRADSATSSIFDNPDQIYNFDVWTASDTTTYDLIDIDLANYTETADTVTDSSLFTNGLVSSTSLQAAIDGKTDMFDVVTTIQNYAAVSSGRNLDQGDVFAFQWAGSTYLGIAGSSNSVASVIKIVGVTGVDAIAKDGDGWYLKDTGPNGG